MKVLLLQTVRLLQDYTAKPAFVDFGLFAEALCNVYITIQIFRKFDRPLRIGNYSLKLNENTT